MVLQACLWAGASAPGVCGVGPRGGGATRVRGDSSFKVAKTNQDESETNQDESNKWGVRCSTSQKLPLLPPFAPGTTFMIGRSPDALILFRAENQQWSWGPCITEGAGFVRKRAVQVRHPLLHLDLSCKRVRLLNQLLLAGSLCNNSPTLLRSLPHDEFFGLLFGF